MRRSQAEPIRIFRAWGLPTLVIALAFMPLAALDAWIGSQIIGQSISPWLPLSLVVAASVALGARAWAGVFIGQFAADLGLGSGQLGAALVLATGHLLCSAVVALVMPKDRSPEGSRMERADPLASPKMFGLGTLATILGLGLDVTFCAWASGPADGGNGTHLFSQASRTLLDDLGGVITLAPLFLLAYKPHREDWSPGLPGAIVITAVYLVALAGSLRVGEGTMWDVLGIMVFGLAVMAVRYPLGTFTAFIALSAVALVLHVPEIARRRFNGDLLEAATATHAVNAALLGISLLCAVYRRTVTQALDRLNFMATLATHTEGITGLGSWHLNLQTEQLTWSDALYALYGLDPRTTQMDKAKAFGLIHPEDRPRMEAAWQQGLQRGSFDETHRLRVNDEVKWVRSRSKFERDAQGQLVQAWGTCQDITSNVHARALQADRDRAEAASEAKSRFLATLSHEIRTPLNGVIGLTELLTDENLDAQQRGFYVSQLNSSARLLNEIVSDVLDLSKIEAGELQIDSQPYPLLQLLSQLRDSYGVLAAQRGLSFDLVVADPVPQRLIGDAVRVRQVLQNFLANALKFTPRGRISLNAGVVDARLRLAVRDTGIGIAQQDMGRLFAPFTQLADVKAMGIGGTGLGLSISRRLAELMGGRVGVESTPDHGSTFWLELPIVEPEDAAPDRIEASVDPSVTSTVLMKAAAAPSIAASTPSRATSAPPDQPLSGLHILVAEDNRINTLVVSRLLERAGARVTCVDDGQAALEALAAHTADSSGERFDLMLMDIHMPVLDGLRTCRAVRDLEAAHPQRPRLPVIAMSAGVLTEQREQALAAGVDDFVGKPIQLKTLLAVIHQHTRRPC